MKKILILMLTIMLFLAGCASGGESPSEDATDAGVFSDISSEEILSSQESSESSEEIISSEPSSIEESSETVSSEEPSSVEPSSEEASLEESASEPEISEPDEPVEEYRLNLNPLTGLYDVTDGGKGKRPVAIMVNNIEYSLPQYGIYTADIIFEMPAEGGLTRFMAMYADYTAVPKVCSVRSCRKYFPAMSEGFDAVYVNCGMNNVIRDYVRSLNLTNYDAYFDSRLFERDQDRLNAGYAYEHTLYFDGPRLPEIMERDGKRTDIESDKQGAFFNFNDIKKPVNPSNTVCEYVRVDFGYNESGFTYDKESNKYLKDFNGDPQIDGNNESQLAFTNLIILETEIGNDVNGMHRDVNWHGGSDHYGYYVSNGYVQKITWSKASEESKLMLFDLNGNPLSINCGNSYISVGFEGETYFSK